ncbi:Transcriptional regulator, Crp/Fnr family, partial [hydrothermal vent metagenome]
GTIRVYQAAEDGREKTLYRVEAGDLCILSLNSLLKNRSFNAIAVTESSIKVLVISSEGFKRSMNDSETFRDYIISTLTERLCETIYIIQETAFNHLNMRLACMLGGLFERNKGPLLSITHQEIAHELGTTREVISRILKEFEKQNCVKLSRGHIELASAEGLQWFSKPQ